MLCINVLMSENTEKTQSPGTVLIVHLNTLRRTF